MSHLISRCESLLVQLERLEDFSGKLQGDYRTKVYPLLEEAKSVGRDIQADESLSVRLRAIGLLLQVTAFYWRARFSFQWLPASVRHAIAGPGGGAVSIDRYISHWLAANSDRMDIFHPELIAELKVLTGREAIASKHLPKGMSIYQQALKIRNEKPTDVSE